MTALKLRMTQHRADLSMTVLVVIWGFNFIAIKDGLASLDPITFNALRFAAGLPLLSLFALYNRSIVRLTRRDFGLILLTTLFGPVGYQVVFVYGLQYTTSTNSSLLLATVPAWTALISIGLGIVLIRQRLLLGIAITLLGVSVVILGRAGAELSLTHNDLIGGGLSLLAALISASSSIVRKPLVDRLGGMRMAIWSYWLNTAGLVLLALPNLVKLHASDVPTGALPNILYSGVLSGVAGFLITNYALHELGPTRTNVYYNFTPIVATIAGIVLLSEPLTVGPLVGGPLTLLGVVIVRHNIYLRRAPAPAPARKPTPSPSH